MDLRVRSVTVGYSLLCEHNSLTGFLYNYSNMRRIKTTCQRLDTKIHPTIEKITSKTVSDCHY
jgi:hypothetical protein